MSALTLAVNALVAAVGAFALIVAANVLYQLLAPRDPTKPPLVFHYVPVIGCAVSYGMDPMAFLDDCKRRLTWRLLDSASSASPLDLVMCPPREPLLYGPVFTYPLLGRKITATLGPMGSNFVLNGKLAHVNAEEAYTHLTTPFVPPLSLLLLLPADEGLHLCRVFGTEVVYDVPNHVLMEQKKFVKFGLTTDNFRRYVGLIRGEVNDYVSKHVFDNDFFHLHPRFCSASSSSGEGTGACKRGCADLSIALQAKATSSVDAFTTSSEITIFTASATLQGREVRAAMNKSFADLYHDLDGGFTPLVRSRLLSHLLPETSIDTAREQNFVFPNLPLPSYRRRDRAQAKMREFYISILEKRRASTDEPDLDMLTALQNQEYKSGEPLTDKQIAHIMIALLMAGQHTSAATGAWAILRLGENQDLQRRLYDEQLEYHLDKETNTLRELTYENFQTPLLMAFIKELLRVHPPLHSLMRKIILDCPVPAAVGAPSAEPAASPSFKKRNEGVEYVIPKGEFVLAAPGYSQIDESIWGKDAKGFRTERWLEEGNKVPGEEDEGEEDYGWGKISKGGKSAYLPFGAGRHRCIGEQFAQVQLGTIIATLVRELTWTLDQPFPGNDYTTMIVMPASPRNVTFTRREGKPAVAVAEA
ncbi:SPOSA6832_03419 [Sporobolomyces salmonicolor]|uniref:SPOSA6832_03419-mRNA-1:cds n=1 Tax=Sporidiobolus salmonicolor TaxID=5005 RepID=A0A0D6EQ41_SPOSA|nr:SPOSA6832_03419 [Sporobolomyces salmonicolor]